MVVKNVGDIKKNKDKTHNYETCIFRFEEVHGKEFDYSKVIYKKNNKTEVEIVCRKHGSFWQKPINHFNGQKCLLCYREHYISRQEAKWLDELNILTLKRQQRVYVFEDKRKYFVVDGYDPSTNTVYEYLGDYWHRKSFKISKR